MNSIFLFQNASHDLQQSWNDTANAAGVRQLIPSQNAGMTDEQRDIANDLCGAESAVDDRLGSGWEHTDFDTSFLDAGSTESEAAGSGEVASGESEGSSEGVGEDNSGAGGGGAVAGRDQILYVDMDGVLAKWEDAAYRDVSSEGSSFPESRS